MIAKQKKLLRNAVIIVLIIAVVWMFVPTHQIIYMAIPASKAKISWMYFRDKSLLTSVAGYFQESGYYGIYIPASDYIYNTKDTGYMFANIIPDKVGENVPIEDQRVLRDINILFKAKGYWTIEKDGNTIAFFISTAREHDRGIAYTIDGSPPVLDFVVDYKLLSSDGHWYYYEEDWTREHRLEVLKEKGLIE